MINRDLFMLLVIFFVWAMWIYFALKTKRPKMIHAQDDSWAVKKDRHGHILTGDIDDCGQYYCPDCDCMVDEKEVTE